MSDSSLQLTLVGRTFALTPLPAHREATCTADPQCGRRVTHRLLSRRTVSVELLCDRHELVWSRENDPETTARTSNS